MEHEKRIRLNASLNSSKPIRHARNIFIGVALTSLVGSSSAAVALTAGNGASIKYEAKKTAVVSLGDSFISGEAGRWKGNGTGWNPKEKATDRYGSDRAYNKLGSTFEPWHIPKWIYGPSYTSDGCHRSDVAEINSSVLEKIPSQQNKPDSGDSLGSPAAKIGVEVPVNIACSGAEAKHIFEIPFNKDGTSAGKKPEADLTQADELAAKAKQYDIKMIVLSIGGNDIKFSDVIKSCIKEWAKPGPWTSSCNPKQDENVKKRLPEAIKNIETAVDTIQRTMREADPAAQYRLVLQSYPNVLPTTNRYENTYKQRFSDGGCPFHDEDIAWSRELVNNLDAVIEGIAERKGTDFLSLKDSFSGHEVCSKDARQTGDKDSSKDSNGRPSVENNEWVRYIATGYFEGDQPEAMHPNALGQQVLGACLALHYNQSADKEGPAKTACTATPGKGYDGISLK